MTERMSPNGSRPLNNARGAAALAGVILVLLVLSTLAFGFLVDSRQKHAGSALNLTSNNAFLTAEAGIRYTMKCLLDTDPGCPPSTGSADWTTLVDFSKTFGDGRGQFDITFLNKQTNSTRIQSRGTFEGAIRVLSRNVARGGCKLAENAITACTGIGIEGTATLNPPGAPTEDNFCSATPIAALTLPPDPTGCPNADYPDFDPALHLDGSGFLTQFQFCQMRITDDQVVKTSAGDTVWVAQNFTLDKEGILEVNGGNAFNVAGSTTFTKTAQVQVNGSVTFHTDVNFKVEKQAVVNVVSGDPADALALVGQNADVKDDAVYLGGIIANNRVRLDKEAQVTGALMSIQDRVDLKKNSVLTYDSSAGISTGGYASCNAGGAVVSADWGEG